MPDDLIREARKQVRNVYGEAFETKASDELVLKLALDRVADFYRIG